MYVIFKKPYNNIKAGVKGHITNDLYKELRRKRIVEALEETTPPPKPVADKDTPVAQEDEEQIDNQKLKNDGKHRSNKRNNLKSLLFGNGDR